MSVFGKTSVGLVRQENEDSFKILKSGGITGIVVADGMGGHNFGAKASEMAVNIFENYFSQLIETPPTREEAVTDLATYVKGANLTIYKMSRSNLSYEGMGTTVITGVITDEYIALASVGDSRIYSWDQENLYLLTEDHTYVNALIKNGDITEEEAITHPKKNVLLQAVGTMKSVDVSTMLLNYEKVDNLLFCSDGLTGMLSDAEIYEILIIDDLKIEQKIELLMNRVYERGARDNVTIVIWRKGV